MSAPADFLAEHGLMLICGVTALLSAGAVALAMQRSPAHRQRLGEIVVAAALLWIILACIPLPRWKPPPGRTAEATSIAPLPILVPIAVDHLKETPRADLMRQFPIIKAERIGSTPFAESPSFSVAHLLAVVYFSGAGLVGAWLLLGHVLLRRMLGGSQPPEDWLAELFRQSMTECGVRGARLRISPKPTRPFSFGLLCPTIVLDHQTSTRQNAGRLRQIFRHELAHLKRRDACGNALFNLAMLLLYFHPLYWWLRSRTFLARELVADAQAAAASDRLSYAADLLALANSSPAPRRRAIAAVGMFIFTNNLSRRITMLVQSRQSWQTRCSTGWSIGTLVASAAAIAVMSLFLGVRPALAQTAQETQQDAKKSETTAKEDAARLDLQKLAADQDQTLANLAQRQADLDQAQARLKATEAQIQLLQKQLAETQGARATGSNKGPNRAANPYEIRLLENQLQTDQVELDRHSIDLRRKEELYQQHAISPLVVEQAQYDVETAKLRVSRDQIELDRVRADVPPHQEPAATPPQPDKTSATVSGRLDLIGLAESYANAVGQVRLARARLDAAHRSSDPHEFALAQAEAENALRKAELLRHIAEIAAEQANTAEQHGEEMHQKGAISVSELDELRARAQILGAILQTSNESTPEPRK
jgi:beta-lactamase regulating signal transducer with metallopeptidase domain